MSENLLDLFDGAESDPVEDPTPATPPSWTVSELNRSLRELLEGALTPLWVTGEVTNWTRARSGHCYFTLKDESSQLRCVMWRRDAVRLPMDPDEGMGLRVFGRVTLYEQRGDLQLQVTEVEADGGEGLWKLAFEKLRKRLEEEGLTDPARRRPLPPFPRTVGVVTSPTGAAFRDILTVIRRRAPWTRVLIRGARVQGEGAAREIAAALQLLAASGEVDVIIVGRGGGSIEDLWAFNEEPVARAVANSPVPVISAVGHETDVTICDLVADLRAPTPSAAAEAAVRDGQALLQLLDRLRPRLARGLRAQVERRRVRAAELARRNEQAVRGLLRPLELRREQLGERLERGMRLMLDDRRRTLASVAAQIEALSPLSTLRRGYAVAQDERGRVLRAADDFAPHRRFFLRVVDGRIECEPHTIERESEGLG